MNLSPSDKKIRDAAVRAWLAGQNDRSLMQLEFFGGPSCGAAGSIVRKWPAEGVVVRLPASDRATFIEQPGDRYLRLRWARVGRRSEIHVTEAK